MRTARDQSTNGHLARKRFGQNFLVDPRYQQGIVDALELSRGDSVVEIGPGLGALTARIIERVDQLHVIEIDRDLVARLQATYPPERLTIHSQDALTFDFSTLPSPLKVVGNLPYNISTPLLFHLATATDRVHSITVMLQKEVVDRMLAAPGGKEYGRLSVMLQVRFAMRRLFNVPPGAFRPAPKVDSSVVQLTPLAANAPKIRNQDFFETLVTTAFTQRRKTLRNALNLMCSEENISAVGLDPQQRPETVEAEVFVALANALEKKGGEVAPPTLR